MSDPINLCAVGAGVDGLVVGDAVGAALGLEVGDRVGLSVGARVVGHADGLAVGRGVGVSVLSQHKSNAPSARGQHCCPFVKPRLTHR